MPGSGTLRAPAGQRAAFEALLQLPDPQIADYLLGYGDRRRMPASGTDLVRARPRHA